MEFDINERIRNLIESKGLSPSSFADTIGVSRPLVSHILSHRNKAGVDVLQRIMEKFTDVDAQWLLTGKGSMVLQDDKQEGKLKEIAPQKPAALKEGLPETAHTNRNVKKAIDRIVIFYSNGTFEVSEPA